jgi:hypothetical protein
MARDEAPITQAVRDDLEGRDDAPVARTDRALHPDLATARRPNAAG